jgi:hypothetical protein
MSEAPEQTCDLCGLPVLKDGLYLNVGVKQKAFCCEGCRGIWGMLNPDAIAKDKGRKNDDQ